MSINQNEQSKFQPGIGAETSVEAGVLTQLRAYLAVAQLPPDGRLPPERELATLLGVTRAELRQALMVLERDGQLWRHVGKGTFVGPRPPDVLDVAALARKSNPLAIMRARIALEPELARLAALNATEADIASLRDLLRGSRLAKTWREYEVYDARIHNQIAEATHNPVLLALFETMNAVRRAVTWGRARPIEGGPPANHHSFSDHERILDSIINRDMSSAADEMRAHLESVENRLLGRAPRN